MSQNIKRASIVSYLTIFINIIIGILLTPFIIKSLGNQEYGIYVLIGSISSYLTLFDFGLTNTTVRFLSIYIHESDKENQDKYFSTNLIFYVILSLIVSIGGFILVQNIVDFFSESFTGNELEVLKGLYYLTLINIVWLLLSGYFQGVLYAFEKFYIPKLLNLLRVLLRSLLIFIVLYLGGKSFEMLIIDTLLNLLVLFLLIIFVVKRITINFHLKSVDFRILYPTLKFSFWIFLGVLMDQFYWRTGSFVLGKYSNTNEIAIFSICMLFTSYFMTFSSSISNFFLPKITKLYVDKASPNELTNLLIKVGRIQFFIISYILFGFLYVGDAFIKFWVGENFKAAYLYTLIIFMPLTIPSIQNVGNLMFEAYSKHKYRIIGNVIMALISVFISVLLLKRIGTIGIPISIALCVFFGQIIYTNFLMYKILKINILKFFKSIFLDNYLYFLAIITIYFLFKFFDNFFIKTCLFLVFNSALIYFFVLNIEEKKFLNNFKIKKK